MSKSKNMNPVHIGYLEESPFGSIYLVVSPHGLCRVSSECEYIELFAEEVEDLYHYIGIIFGKGSI